MDGVEAKRKKWLIAKTWERCRSSGRGNKSTSSLSSSISTGGNLLAKSKSWTATSSDGQDRGQSNPNKRRVAPSGCFSVYVGPERHRFVIKAECANHPLFKMLLDEAESEYGFCSQGPIILPCDVEVFIKVLFEMDSDNDSCVDHPRYQRCGSCARSPNSYHLFSPARSKSLAAMNQLV
ncbi:hypothetical protein Ancab_020441 [Ancistrocladus abbreviatus]